MSNLKKILSFLPEPIRDSYLEKKYKNQLAVWEKKGKPLPTPHIVKQETIKEYQQKYNIDVLIETGTYLGDMVYAQRKNFKQIYTIELSDDLYKRAIKRFSGYRNINLVHGDSGVMLSSILKTVKQKSIFWLDGHYSGGITARGNSDCPILQELDIILDTKLEHIILIDDAREFGSENEDYPQIDVIKDLIKNKGYENSLLEIKDDIIRIELKH